MNMNHDTTIAAKIGARDLIRALSGHSIENAIKKLAAVEFSVINGQLHHPDDISHYREKLKGLPQGASLEAIRLARQVVNQYTTVDCSDPFTQHVFELWEKEASLAGTRIAA